MFYIYQTLKKFILYIFEIFFCLTIYFRLDSTLNYGLERVWCISALKGSNTVAIGYDEGSVTIKLGKEEPTISMDSSGKILWAKNSDVQYVNLKTVDSATLDSLQGMMLNCIYKKTLRYF